MPSGAGDQFKFPEPRSLTHSIVPVLLRINREWIFCHIPDPAPLPAVLAATSCSAGVVEGDTSEQLPSPPPHWDGSSGYWRSHAAPSGGEQGLQGSVLILVLRHCRKRSFGSGSSNRELRIEPDRRDGKTKSLTVAQVTQARKEWEVNRVNELPG